MTEKDALRTDENYKYFRESKEITRGDLMKYFFVSTYSSFSTAQCGNYGSFWPKFRQNNDFTKYVTNELI